MQNNADDKDIIVLGAGITGLTSAYFASYHNKDIMLVEKDKQVGGLAKTIEYNNFRFDLGGHRFVTNNHRLQNFVTNLLGEDHLTVDRASKIFLNNRYINYPLEPVNALLQTGGIKAFKIIFDYIYQQIKVSDNNVKPKSLEDWIVAKFGKSLYSLFFKSYSEKVWGLDCKQIDKDWIVERIQGLSLGQALRQALLRNRQHQFKTLADKFIYPKNGIGDIVDSLSAGINPRSMYQGSDILNVYHQNGQITGIEIKKDGKPVMYHAQNYLNTIPLSTLVKLLNPAPPVDIIHAAENLRSRDMILVTLFLDVERVSHENWIYFPDSEVPFGRFHEPKNWSPNMAPRGFTSLVCEYFCFHTDEIWQENKQSVLDKTTTSLEKMGLIDRKNVIDAKLIKIRHAYPLFELGYRQNSNIVADYCKNFTNLKLAGRSGSFRYYNLDQAMLSGIEAVGPMLNNGLQDSNQLLDSIIPTDKDQKYEMRTRRPSLAT